ncbi:MAG: hypothetical protein C0506_04515 [Anaerolinea sp.]|nr:hypothetical protein [Anaerolinea sp.]
MNLTSTWRGRGALAAILATAGLGLALVLASAPPTSAQTAPSANIKQITLTGGEENPPTTANAIGYFSGTLTDGKLEFDLSAVGPELTAAHIHAAAKGANGAVVAFLFGPADPAVGALHPTGTITQANLVGPLAGNWKGFADAMAKGELYVNVHSKANPGGVIRAQIPATTLTPAAPKTGNSAGSNGPIGATQGAGVLLLVVAAGALVVVMAKRRA